MTGQTLSAVTSESGDLVGDAADGLLGMGFPAISSLNAVRILVSPPLRSSDLASQDPFFQTAVEQGAVSEGVFAFKLASGGSELYLGGTDSSLYSGSIEYHDLSSSVGYWQIGGASAIVNGKTAASGFQTIIDR